MRFQPTSRTNGLPYLPSARAAPKPFIMHRFIPLLTGLLLLTACGGGSGSTPTPPSPPPVPVETPAFESYVTDHSGFNRIRRDYADPSDAGPIADFESGSPDAPAGYRNLIALNEALYGGRMVIEVLAEVDTDSGRTTRLLRLTADQTPFRNDGPAAASGRFHLRGENFAWVSIDGGPVLSGSDDRGLVDMVLDFDTQTASLNLRTGVGHGSEIRTEITASDLPFDIRSGAYGGDINIQIWDPDGPDILSIDGSLRGNVGGTPRYVDGLHDLSTSGLYTGTGTDAGTGTSVQIDGIFVGVDPNALR